MYTDCMHVYIYIYTCVIYGSRFSVYVCVHICKYIHVHMWKYVYIYVYMYLYVYIYMCALVDVIRIDVLHSSGGGAFLEVVVSFTAELLPDSTWRDA